MNKPELGQVFTGKLIADYMVSLFDIDKSASILDPCFGGGAFIKSLLSGGYQNITGCEIDTEWVERATKEYHGVKLECRDFLQYGSDADFDGIIMNPPYIRQEKIDDLSQFGITKTILANNPIFAVLPKTANLYMYFVLKGISLLKPGGEMVVIFPSSWLDAKVGIEFRNYLFSECDVREQIHIYGEVFEEDALVDVVILKLLNQKSTDSTKITSLRSEGGFLHADNSDDTNIQIGFTVPFSHYGTVRRGLTTGYNEAFINPVIENCPQQYLRPILSSPKDLSGFDTSAARYDDLLNISDSSTISEEIKSYIEKYERIILETKKPKTLYEKIQKGEKWYALNDFSGEGIIFSYFVRNEMKFILHSGNQLIRDNFYIIRPDIDKYIFFAFLNNYYTFYQLECEGKKYGAGLLKLQRYDIEKMMFPDISKYSQETLNKLSELSKKLIASKEVSIIYEITEIISSQASISADRIVHLYNAKKMRRLEKK